MLKATELRLNNIVKYKVNSDTYFEGKITILRIQEGVYNGAIDYHYPLEFGEPIPLSDEWLVEKLGCTVGTDPDMYRHRSGVWLTKADGDLGYFVYGFRYGYYIHYVHQYQNVIFALTGEELEIKP